MQKQNRYLDYLMDPNFQGLSRFFVLSFEDNVHRASYQPYFPTTVQRKDYILVTNGQFFYQFFKKFKNIW